jgi:hypothetical protein
MRFQIKLCLILNYWSLKPLLILNEADMFFQVGKQFADGIPF